MFIGPNQQLGYRPRRIISLVPSITELLFDLGLEDETIGITKFCVHPRHWFEQKTRIGGTKNLHIDKILGLQPDLILANKEENTREQVELLSQKCPVWLTDVKNVSDAQAMISDIGRLTGKEEKAEAMVREIASVLSVWPVTHDPIPTAYLIWKDPYMTIGGDTYIHDMLRIAGCHNVFGNRNRYPVVDLAELAESGCRLVLLSSEPYPFTEKHITELALALPGTRVLLADGEMFSWYGSRLLKALGYLQDFHAQIRV